MQRTGLIAVTILATAGLANLAFAQNGNSPVPPGDVAEPTGDYTITAVLSGESEVPANNSGGAGTLSGKVLETDHILQFSITYEGLSGPATAAHFHGPAGPSENAPPVIPIDGDLTSPIEGEVTLTPEQEDQLLAGNWYFNIHTAANPAGEIRGQVDADEEVVREDASPTPSQAPPPAP